MADFTLMSSPIVSSAIKTQLEEANTMDLDDVGDMSDEELQEAFAAGLIKPGLNILCEQKEIKNNVEGLKLKLNELELKMNWIERLDLISIPAPMPPEAHEELRKDEIHGIVKLRNRINLNNNMKKDTTMDDFKREMLFHRQAQSSVLEGIKRLKSLGVLTKRPDDYFAEMAKSDNHMHKVRERLAAKQAGVIRAEKINKLRKLKKFGKEAQVVNKQKQEIEKKKTLNEIKKFRKGLRKDLSFLENNQNKKVGKSKAQSPHKSRALRDQKFGFGGKKKGSKRNTKESSAYLGNFTKKVKKSGARNNKRLGKSKRIQKRSRKSRS